jgi:hypothetical protein
MGRLLGGNVQELTACAILIACGGIACGAEPDLPCGSIDNPAGLSTLCGFAKPEDVQFIRSKSVVIVSEQGWQAPRSGGSISVVGVDAKTLRLTKKTTLWPNANAKSTLKLLGDPSCREPPMEMFSPHGLSALERRSGVRLAILNHGDREAVELFELRGSGDTLSLSWQGCVPLPPDTAGNDVAIHPDGRLFVTNYIPSTRDIRALLSVAAAMRGEITGDALEWSPKRGWRHLPHTAGAMPNGILLDARHERLFVAELGKQRILEFTLQRDGTVVRRAEFAFRDTPDNLNWTERRTILVAGQTRKDGKQWSVAEIDLKSGTVRSLFEAQTAIHSVTAATDIGGGIVFGSTGDQRIAIARWPTEPGK